jgi:hypothetical protein
MVNNLLYYSCYNDPACFDATAPSSGSSSTVLDKLHKHLNVELVIFLKINMFVVKI